MNAALNYERLKREIADAALLAHRDPKTITLVAISKNHAWEEAKPLYQAGCRHFGENRLQEALEKIEQAPSDVIWHLVGTLQKNKVRKAVGKFTYIHSVDSLELATKIAEVSQEMGLVTSIFLQVNITGEETKHGFTPAELISQFYEIYTKPGLRIEGLMTMAPQLAREKEIQACFSALRTLARQFGVSQLSMGMSNDWKIAVAQGATFLRIGSALFE